MIRNTSRRGLRAMWIGIALVSITGCDGGVDNPAPPPVRLGGHAIVQSGTAAAFAPAAVQVTDMTQQTQVELRHFAAYEQYRNRFDVCPGGNRDIPAAHPVQWRKTVSISRNGEEDTLAICFRGDELDK